MIAVALIFGFSCYTVAQSITGDWYGKANVQDWNSVSMSMLQHQAMGTHQPGTVPIREQWEYLQHQPLSNTLISRLNTMVQDLNIKVRVNAGYTEITAI